MKLNSLDRQRSVTHRHDKSVGRFGRYLETIRKRFALDHERVISAGFEVTVDAVENCLSIVLNLDRFSMDRLGCPNHSTAEMLPDRLVSQTDTEDGNFFS